MVHKGTMIEHPSLTVVFYKTGPGKEPVREWLRDLSNEEKKIIGKDITKMQLLWPIGLPLVKKLDDNLWELRSDLDNRTARILFAFYKNQMVLLHGFIKKSQKTPKRDMDLARQRKAVFKKG
jgi:phage-related protein